MIHLILLCLVLLEYTNAWIPNVKKLGKLTSKRADKLLHAQVSEDAKITANVVNETVADASITPLPLTLNFDQIKPFLDIAVPYYKEDAKARSLLITVVLLTLLNSGVSVGFSYVNRDFYNALSARNEEEFYAKIVLFFGFLSLAVPLTVAYRFYREKLSLYWREGLTNKVLDQYCINKMFYNLEVSRDPLFDNPDQRIAEDIRAFTRTSLDFFITLLSSFIDLLSFALVLININPTLFVTIILYSGFGSIVTSKLGQELVQLNYDRLQKEANFRFSLIRIRENAESIAFYDTSARGEMNFLMKNFNEIVSNQMGIINVQRNLEAFTTSYRYLVQVLPSLIVAPLYFKGLVELGTITQSYGAFNHILGDFSLIINQFESLSAFSAGLSRLGSFLDKLNASDTTVAYTLPKVHLQQRKLPDEVLVRCSNLTLLTPDGSRTLIGGVQPKLMMVIDDTYQNQGINIEIKKNESILISGNSGAGKSSLLRCIAGLWATGNGSITWNSDADSDDKVPIDVFFLPQKPYNLLGSLRQQIMYPLVIDASTYSSSNDVEQIDNYLLEILKEVKLDNLADRMCKGKPIKGLYKEKDWSKVLSLGEQQRLAFARVLYNKPKVVVVDEATSAMDVAAEEAMYKLLQSKGISYISVGHRPTLEKFHNRKLTITSPYADIAVAPLSTNA